METKTRRISSESRRFTPPRRYLRLTVLLCSNGEMGNFGGGVVVCWTLQLIRLCGPHDGLVFIQADCCGFWLGEDPLDLLDRTAKAGCARDGLKAQLHF